MMHHLFADFAKSGVLSYIRYVAMHFAINLDVLHYIATICLESAVKVVQVSYSAYPSCGGIE